MGLLSRVSSSGVSVESLGFRVEFVGVRVLLLRSGVGGSGPSVQDWGSGVGGLKFGSSPPPPPERHRMVVMQRLVSKAHGHPVCGPRGLPYRKGHPQIT